MVFQNIIGLCIITLRVLRWWWSSWWRWPIPVAHLSQIMMAYRSSKQLSTDQIPNIPSPFFKNLKYDIKNIRFKKKNVRPCTNLFSFRGLFVHYLQNWKRSFIIIISHTFVEIKTSYMRNYKCVRALIDITLVVLQLLWKTYINYFQCFTFEMKSNYYDLVFMGRFKKYCPCNLCLIITNFKRELKSLGRPVEMFMRNIARSHLKSLFFRWF